MPLRFLLLVFFILPYFVDAQEVASHSRYLARIELHSAEELNGALMRAEELFAGDRFKSGTDAPVVFVLHGPEAKTLLTNEYKLNKSLVDLAARLSAFQIVDVRVCKTWMGSEGLDESQLPPFISTVPYGPEEKRRLLNEGKYVYF
jgi:intracellular sulfur oxidation DsrE/DsrF family protein